MGNAVNFMQTSVRKDVLSKIISYRTLMLSPTDERTGEVQEQLKKSFQQLDNWDKIIIGLALFTVKTWNREKFDIGNYELVTNSDVCDNWNLILKHIYHITLGTVDDIVFVKTFSNGHSHEHEHKYKHKRTLIFGIQFIISELKIIINPFRMTNLFCKMLTEYPDTTFPDLKFCSFDAETALNNRTGQTQYFTIFVFEYLGYKYYYQTMYRINLCNDFLGCWVNR